MTFTITTTHETATGTTVHQPIQGVDQIEVQRIRNEKNRAAGLGEVVTHKVTEDR